MSAQVRWWLRAAVLAAVLAGLLGLAYYLRDILNPLLIALGIAYALNPLVVKFSRQRWFGRPLGRTGATVCIFIAFLGAFVGSIAIATPLVASEVTHLTRKLGGEPIFTPAQVGTDGPITRFADGSGYTHASYGRLTETAEPFVDANGNGAYDKTEPYDDWDADTAWTPRLFFADFDGDGVPHRGYLRDAGDVMGGWIAMVQSTVKKDERVRGLADKAATAAQERAAELAGGGFNVLTWIGGALAGTGRALWVAINFLVLLPFYAFFFMRNLDSAAERGILYIPARVRPRTVEILTRIHVIMSAFIRGRAFIALVVSIMAWLGFMLCGVPYALVLGILTGVTILIPLLPIVAAVLPAELLLVAEGAGIGYMAGVIVVYTIIQVVESFYLSPRVLGEEGDMHPVTALVSIMIGGHLLGLLGAILAIPMAATAKILFRELLLPEMREVAGMGPGTETGETKLIVRKVKGELIGGGLVKTELDEPSSEPAPAPAGDDAPNA